MSNVLKSKYLFGVMIVAAVVVVAFAMFATSAFAAYTHSVTLKQGSSGSQVMALQQALGVGADGSFGPMTKQAVMDFQSSKGLTADGVVGSMTGAALGGVAMGGSYPAGCTSTSGYSSTTGAKCDSGGSYPAGCTSTSGYSSTTGAKCDGGGSSGPVAGGAGSITVNDVGTYSSEEVGEGEDEAKVLAFEVEADDDSDVDVTSVKVEFEQVTAADSEDITDYFDTVTIWMDGEEVGSADSDKFTENSDVYTKSVSLNGAVVKAGDTATFVVSINALSNLDSGDIDSDSFTVDVLNVRFEDGEGVVTTEDTDADALDQTFDFATFATATDVELKVALNDDDKDTINKARVVNVETGSSDTDDVEILSFTIEAKGDSDLNIDQIPFLVTTTGETDESLIVRNVHLMHGSDELDSDTVAAGGVGLFEDLDFDMSAGDKEEFTITVDLQDLTGALDEGDTVKMELTSGNVDAIDATDESGEDLSTVDLTGSAVGEASEVRDVGVMLKFVSSDADVSHIGDIVGSGAGDDDQGTFVITFDVTAFDGDAYVDGTVPALAGGGTASDIDIAATAGTPVLTASTITSPTGATLTGAINADARFKVAEGDTERFTITAVVTPSTTADATVAVSIANVLYALTDVDGDILFTFNLADYKTPDLYLNAN